MKYEELNKLSKPQAFYEIRKNIKKDHDAVPVKYSLSGLVNYLLGIFTPSNTCHRLFRTYGYKYAE